MFDSDHIVELQHMLEEVQGIVRVKPRIASLDDAHKLLEEGYDIKWISRKSGIPGILALIVLLVVHVD